ncbi:hypothetical protein POM88_048666 [Heracleum sosnowskyi]|uniref:Uncharacterized protein n=1 Tax=Heracleum sosnowskyi TaxID=360622 RepID=A0AAD8LYP5_9APIA|nr:hypothetical protein POM88_048666 [Heracleum sosnowskyi]
MSQTFHFLTGVVLVMGELVVVIVGVFMRGGSGGRMSFTGGGGSGGFRSVGGGSSSSVTSRGFGGRSELYNCLPRLNVIQVLRIRPKAWDSRRCSSDAARLARQHQNNPHTSGAISFQHRVWDIRDKEGELPAIYDLYICMHTKKDNNELTSQAIRDVLILTMRQLRHGLRLLVFEKIA